MNFLSKVTPKRIALYSIMLILLVLIVYLNNTGPSYATIYQNNGQFFGVYQQGGGYVSIVRENKIRDKNVARSLRRDTGRVYRYNTKDHCFMIVDDQKRDGCIADWALEQGSPSLCVYIKSFSNRVKCDFRLKKIQKASTLKKRLELRLRLITECNSIKNDYARDNCISKQAHILKEPMLCSEIHRPDVLKGCIGRLPYTSQWYMLQVKLYLKRLQVSSLAWILWGLWIFALFKERRKLVIRGSLVGIVVMQGAILLAAIPVVIKDFHTISLFLYPFIYPFTMLEIISGNYLDYEAYAFPFLFHLIPVYGLLFAYDKLNSKKLRIIYVVNIVLSLISVYIFVELLSSFS